MSSGAGIESIMGGFPLYTELKDQVEADSHITDSELKN